jgi:hypothetical protein
MSEELANLLSSVDLLRAEIRSLHHQASQPVRMLNRKAAAAYIGVGATWFDMEVRPEIPELRRKGITLFAIEDLDRWIDVNLAQVNAKRARRKKVSGERYP